MQKHKQAGQKKTSSLLSASKKLYLTFEQTIGLVFYLAFAAGLINSVGFLGFGQFVSHLSGHATYAAVEYSQKNYFLAVTSLSAILFFIAGSATTAFLMHGKTLQSPNVTFVKPFLLEIILLVYIIFDWVYYKNLSVLNDSFEKAHSFLALSFAMGLQNASLRKTAQQTLRTTHITGVGTDVGIAIGSALFWGWNTIRHEIIMHWKQHRSVKDIPNIFLESIKAAYVRSRVEKLFLHLFTLIAFLLGAAIGTFGFFEFKFYILMLPCIILGLLVLRTSK